MSLFGFLLRRKTSNKSTKSEIILLLWHLIEKNFLFSCYLNNAVNLFLFLLFFIFWLYTFVQINQRSSCVTNYAWIGWINWEFFNYGRKKSVFKILSYQKVRFLPWICFFNILWLKKLNFLCIRFILIQYIHEFSKIFNLHFRLSRFAFQKIQISKHILV